MQIEIKKLTNSEIEIIGEVPADDFEAGRETALRELSDGVKVDGFRPGNIPEKILIDKIGESALLERMAEIALRKTYSKIIEERKIQAIGRPDITITKIAKGNPLGFKIKTATVPEVELPDYEEISKKINEKKEEDITVEDKEIEQTVEYLRKSRSPAGGQEADGKDKGETAAENLPELTDEFVKTLGKFENVADFKKKIRENILADKKTKAREKKRMEILEKIIELSKMEVPKILVEAEKNKILQETKANIAQMGLKWENYLGHFKKTEEEIVRGWEKDALKRVQISLVLDKIAEAENIEIGEKELSEETEKMVEFYKNSGQDIDKNRVGAYIYGILRNEKVFRKLEKC